MVMMGKSPCECYQTNSERGWSLHPFPLLAGKIGRGPGGSKSWASTPPSMTLGNWTAQPPAHHEVSKNVGGKSLKKLRQSGSLWKRGAFKILTLPKLAWSIMLLIMIMITTIMMMMIDQVVESEKTAKWQYTQHCEELGTEIKKLREEVNFKFFSCFLLFTSYLDICYGHHGRYSK